MNFPIEFSYTLSADEVFEASYEAGLFKTTGTRRWIYTALLAVSVVFNIYTYFRTDRTGSYLLVALLSVAVLFAIWYYPERELRNKAERNKTEKPVPVKINEDKIEISEGEGKWEVPFDNTFSFKDKEKYLIIYSKAGRVVAFPKKDIDAEILPQLIEFFAEKSVK